MGAANIQVSSFAHKIITLSVMLATVMYALDTTIANVALPHMQGSLSATQEQMSWVLTFYIISSAIATPLAGWLSGQFGQRAILICSVVGFTIASVLCGIAQNINEMVFFRLLQGIFGAALAPLSQSVLFDINPPEKFGKAMATWGIGVTLGPILGPVLGGWLTEYYNWRWVFYINVPIGILSFLGLITQMPVRKNLKRTKLDIFGFAALSLGVGALQLILDRGSLKDWFNSHEIITEAMLASIGFYWFIIHTMTNKKPFINPVLFKDRNFMMSCIFMFIVGIVMFASLALTPPLLQTLLGYPVVLTGLIMAPRGIGTMIAMVIVGKIIEKVDPRKIMAIGLVLTAYSVWQMIGISLYMDSSIFIISGFLQGIGLGCVYVPVSVTAFASLPNSIRTEGTAFFSLIRNIGSAVGISLVTFLLTENMQIIHASMVEHITPYNAHHLPLSKINLNIHNAQNLMMLNGMITQQSAIIAYINDFKLILWLVLLTIPFLTIMQNPHRVQNK